jgi:hypothetical protein
VLAHVCMQVYAHAPTNVLVLFCFVFSLFPRS